MNKLWNTYKQKAQDIRPFLRTKVGSRLAILAIVDFIILFVAPLMHGFVGTAIFGCVASVYLMLVWRRFDREHVIVPTVILCIPMLLDMAIYHKAEVIVGFLVAIIAMFLVALLPSIPFYDNAADLLTAYLIGGALCVIVVVLACIMLVVVNIAWWILCIIAFFLVVAIFMGVVFSTAAYTASDGRRQARRNREAKPQSQEQRYREYRPRERDTKVYNLDDDDFRDAE
ncbi:MAG: hypothetical protein IJ171_01330 [Ruminococcus sp.]|nr:hypothetical protein [Ruminococcus sp.]